MAAGVLPFRRLFCDDRNAPRYRFCPMVDNENGDGDDRNSDENGDLRDAGTVAAWPDHPMSSHSVIMSGALSFFS